MDSSRYIVIFFTLSLYFLVILSPTIASKENDHHNKNSPNAIPYETVNRFCLYRRLYVERPFCLSVLKRSHAAYAKKDNLVPLLEVAINSTSIYVCKTLSYLQDTYAKFKTREVEECLSCYEEIAGYMTKVITDVSQEPAIAGLDGEVIISYVNRCDKAVVKHKGILEKNQLAIKHATLMIDIADGLSSTRNF